MRDNAKQWSLIIGALGLALTFVFAQAYFEARAFNKNTDKNVSTWDALFLELRIDGDK